MRSTVSGSSTDVTEERANTRSARAVTPPGTLTSVSLPL